MIIEGKNPVREALAADKTFEKLMAEKSSDYELNRIVTQARAKGVKVVFCDKAALDRVSPTKKHQGLVAFTSEFRDSDVEEIKEYAEERGEPLFLLILDGVEDPHNLGSILRVAECAGVHGVIIPKNRAVGVNDTVVRVSAGASEHVKVARVVNINDVIRDLKKSGVWVYCADMDGENIFDAKLTGNIALVVGGEGYGVKKLTKELCDGVISLPLKGKINSLNASVAAGIVVYEVMRNRDV